MSNFDLVLKLFIQFPIILLTCRFIIYFGKKYFMQAPVVSEMIAGVLLGPSFLGLIAPSWQQWLFPTHPIPLADGSVIPNQSMSILFALSQIGVVLYMFFIGLELDVDIVKNNIRKAGTIITTGIAFPFILGVAFVPFIYGKVPLFQPGISLTSAMLFLGAAFSITAFPMLSRILYETGIAKTKLGTLAISASAGIDAGAWCLLAVIMAIVRKDHAIASWAILGGVGFAIFMFTAGRWCIEKVIKLSGDGEELTVGMLAVLLSIVMLSAWITDSIGIYAIFGAFIAGVVMPRGRLVSQLGARFEHFTTAFLLPTFFVFSGLNTQIGLINSPTIVGLTIIIIILSILGKGVGCTLAVKLNGESWRDALTVGTLMNSRGLMELIILSIGLEYHIITPTLFTMLVIMAIITTVMTSPIYYLLNGKNKVERAVP